MTTSVRSWGGESRCFEWAQFATEGGGAYCTSNWRELLQRHVLLGVVFRNRPAHQSGGIMYFWPVYTLRESAGVLQVTGSLLHEVVA